MPGIISTRFPGALSSFCYWSPASSPGSLALSLRHPVGVFVGKRRRAADTTPEKMAGFGFPRLFKAPSGKHFMIVFQFSPALQAPKHPGKSENHIWNIGDDQQGYH